MTGCGEDSPLHGAALGPDPAPFAAREATWAQGDRIHYGRRTFEIGFVDCIPLRSPVGAVDGVAFVLPFSPSLASKRTHRVYLKNMLLSEEAEGLVPEWAFFVKCAVNADDLRPTAAQRSRDGERHRSPLRPRSTRSQPS